MRCSRLRPCKPTTSCSGDLMVKSSSDAVSANLDNVRRWPVDDFWKRWSSGRSRWALLRGRTVCSRVGARTESAREIAMESGRGFAGGEPDPSNELNRTGSTLCARECVWEGLFVGVVGVVGVVGLAVAGLSRIGEVEAEAPLKALYRAGSMVCARVRACDWVFVRIGTSLADHVDESNEFVRGGSDVSKEFFRRVVNAS